MTLFTAGELAEAADLVHAAMLPTPQHNWPLLDAATGCETWVKHENHAPTGAFKVRGGITFVEWLRRTNPHARGICTATRGNHGQSQARAARAAGLSAKVFVPYGNSIEKNAAMRAFGAEVVEFGDDFETARQEAERVADAEGLVVVPPFHRELMRGVATGSLELLQAVPDLHTLYVPIGCGSGICGAIAARDALNLKTRIVGVVSTRADAAKQSFDSTRLVETASAATFADGIAVRMPVGEALEIYVKGAERVVAVRDDAVAEAMRLYFRATHNVAEGAGAAPLAALMHEHHGMAGRRVALVLSGGNVDTGLFVRVLSGQTPEA